MSKILGKDVSVFLAVNASPQILQPIGCSRTCVLTTQVNIAGKSTIGSGVWQEFKALNINWNISVDGLTTIDQNINMGLLRSIQFDLREIFVTFIEASTDSQIEYSGYGIITNVTTNGTYNDVETYSVQIQGTGSLFNSGNFRIIQIQIDVPMAGETTLTFDFDSVPGATAYTIRVRDLTAGTTIENTAGAAPRNIVIDSTHDYAFAYRPEFGTGPGDWSFEIFYP